MKKIFTLLFLPIDLTKKPKGIYLVKIKQGTEIFQKKLLFAKNKLTLKILK
jgi:hypothetical protein